MLLAHLRLMLSLLSFMALEMGPGGDDSGDVDSDPDDGDNGGHSGARGSTEGDDDGGDDDWQPPKTPEELNRMIARRIRRAEAKAAETARKDFEREQATKTAKEKDDVRELLRLSEEKIQDLEEKLKAADTRSLRDRIAKAHKLPDDLADLLQGETEEELKASAAKLQKYVKAGDAGDDEESTEDVDNDSGARGSRKRAPRRETPQFRINTPVKTVKMPGA